MDRSEHEKFEEFTGIVTYLSTKETVQCIAHTFFAVPLEVIQMFSDGMIFIVMCYEMKCFLNQFHLCERIGLFQVEVNIVHIIVSDGIGAVFSFPSQMVLSYKFGYDPYQPVLSCKADYKTDRDVAEYYHSKTSVIKGIRIRGFQQIREKFL